MRFAFPLTDHAEAASIHVKTWIENARVVLVMRLPKIGGPH
jgi:hypothetical protein